ncbi:hypothetical protein [Infirmifilum sp.]|uniref:hypothetical protein n=1 Tax=Infirmifilum sp. TaxID=2856575 RepID=UPI003D0E9498
MEKDINMVKARLIDMKGLYVRGHAKEIYLPLTADIRGFWGLKVIVSEEAPSKVVKNFKGLVSDLAMLEPGKKLHEYTERTKRAIMECVERTKRLGGIERGLAFVNRYLYVNKDFIKDALATLVQEGKSEGSIGIIEALIIDEGYMDVYKECGKIEVGNNKTDKLKKRITTLARFYDHVLVLTGAAVHLPRSPEELKFGKGRGKPYTLFQTPFTRALHFVLTHHENPELVDEYVGAYVGFVGRVVEAFARQEPFEVAVVRASNYLDAFKESLPITNSSPEDNVLRRSVLALWMLLETLR